MNQEEREIKIIEHLQSIYTKLEEISVVLYIGQSDSIQNVKSKFFQGSPLKKKVYDLCSGKQTVSEIARSLGKSLPSISKIIAKLLDAKLITETKRGTKKYFRRII